MDNRKAVTLGNLVALMSFSKPFSTEEQSMTSMTFKKVRSTAESDDGAIKITLFRDGVARVCGWFLGPVQVDQAGVTIPYLPRSKRALASIAIVRAITAAEHAEAPLCIIDPDDLWEPAWQGD